MHSNVSSCLPLQICSLFSPFPPKKYVAGYLPGETFGVRKVIVHMFKQLIMLVSCMAEGNSPLADSWTTQEAIVGFSVHE